MSTGTTFIRKGSIPNPENGKKATKTPGHSGNASTQKPRLAGSNTESRSTRPARPAPKALPIPTRKPDQSMLRRPNPTRKPAVHWPPRTDYRRHEINCPDQPHRRLWLTGPIRTTGRKTIAPRHRRARARPRRRSGSAPPAIGAVVLGAALLGPVGTQDGYSPAQADLLTS